MSRPTANSETPGVGSPVAPAVGPNGALLAAPRPEAIRRHLEQVLISAEMCRSKKLCQFLRFTVEEVLRGHGSELKEYAIAVGVFRRSREFDPGADPIVRVQARRLRSKLERYYQNEGRGEPVRIEYPVGSYSPVFTRPAPSAGLAKSGLLTGQVPAAAPARHIAVLPFVNVGPEDGRNFSDGLTDELMHALSSWPGVRVAARASCFHFKGKSVDVRKIGEWLGVSALVSGSVRIEGTRLRVLAQWIDALSGVNLWSGVYEKEVEGILATQENISREIAGVLRLKFGDSENGMEGTAGLIAAPTN